jgi:hypothetical protein
LNDIAAIEILFYQLRLAELHLLHSRNRCSRLRSPFGEYPEQQKQIRKGKQERLQSHLSLQNTGSYNPGRNAACVRDAVVISIAFTAFQIVEVVLLIVRFLLRLTAVTRAGFSATEDALAWDAIPDVA